MLIIESARYDCITYQREGHEMLDYGPHKYASLQLHNPRAVDEEQPYHELGLVYAQSGFVTQ